MWSTGATLSNLKVGLFAFGGAATTTSLHVAFDFFHLSVPAEQQIRSLDDYVGFLDLDRGSRTTCSTGSATRSIGSIPDRTPAESSTSSSRGCWTRPASATRS